MPFFFPLLCTRKKQEQNKSMKKGHKNLRPLCTFAATLAAGSMAAASHVETESVLEKTVPVAAVADTAKLMDIEELVIIATPKENNRLRQQSLSSTSLSQQDMRSNGVNSVKALTGLVPNLFIPDYGSKLTTSVYVRGIGSRINTPAVGLYVDNIPFIDKSAFDFNYSDIERVDVLRGPQGTLYGRNTMGGLIRIYTKSPFTYQGTDLTLSAATYNNYKASVSHYHRISDRFAFSANLFYDHKGGFFENIARDNSKIDKSDEIGGRLRAIYFPKENLKLDFTLNYEFTDQGGYPYMLASLPESDVFYNDIKGDIGKVAYNNECGYKRNLINGGLNIEHQADNFILSSVTGFQYLKDQMDLDQDFTRKDIYTMMQKQNSKTISEEFVLKSKPGSRWQWTTGASGFYQWLDTEAPVTFHKDGISSLIEDNVNGIFAKIKEEKPMMPDMSLDITDNNILIGGNFKSPMLGAGIYHQSTIHDVIFDGLSFTAGLRMEYEKYWLDYNSNADIDFDFRISVMPMPFQGLNSSPMVHGSLSHDYIQLLPKFALQYDIDKKNNIYASVSKGYRSGGYNIQMFSDILQGEMINGMIAVLDETSHGMVSQMGGDKIPHYESDIQKATLYKPEYSWNYEMGAHTTLFDGKVQADVAAYYMDTRNQQISRFAQSGLGRTTVNAGKSRSLGAEAAVVARITDAFTLNGNYGYTHATFTDYVTNDKSGNEVSYNGKYVPFVPMHTFGAGAQYVFALKHCNWLDNITVNANYRGAGRIYWTEQNNVSQSVYGTLNGRISLNKGNGQIGLWINNALNTKYQTIYFETMSRGFEQQGRPMQIGIDLRCRF